MADGIDQPRVGAHGATRLAAHETRRANRWLKWALWAGAAGLAGYLLVGIAFWLYSAPKDELLPFSDGFESADLRQWNRLGWKQLCCEHSMRVVGDPVRSGQHAVRVELNRGEPLVRGNQRAEMRLPAAAMGATYRYRFSVYLPADWPADPLPVNLVQWHSVSDKLLLEGGPSMPLRLVVIGDRFIIDNFWDSKRVTKFAYLPEHPEGNRLLWSGPLQRGRWIDWEFTVRWVWQAQGAEQGRVQVRQNGVLVADAGGPNTYRDFVAPYMKFGVYVPAWSHDEFRSPVIKRIAYFDDIQVDKP